MTEYTEEQKQQFVEDFAARKRKQIFASLPIAGIVILFIIAGEDQSILSVQPEIWVPIAMIFIIATLLFSFRNWRCPACSKYLGRGFGPAFFPGCGVALK